MEPFIIGLGIGCLVGIAAAYLIVSPRINGEPLSWIALLEKQNKALEMTRPAQPETRAVTRLRSKDITWEI